MINNFDKKSNEKIQPYNKINNKIKMPDCSPQGFLMAKERNKINRTARGKLQ